MTNNKQLIELTGEIEDIIFRNEANGYTVMDIISGDETVTTVGTVASVSVGEEVKLIGSYKKHPTYGEQFAFETCERTIPSTSSAILKYLSSGTIKGVGPTTAKRLVEAFGDKTLEVIENEPERLAKIKGISNDKALAMSKDLQKIFGVRKVMTQLAQYGISSHQAINAWNMYGNKVIELIEENPYMLCNQGLNISFEIADNIAIEQNRQFDDNCRVRAGLLHILYHNQNNGHTCLPMNKLIEACCKFLQVSTEKVEENLNNMLSEGELILDIVGEKEFIFLPEMHSCESYSATRIAMALRFPAEQIDNIDDEINYVEHENHITYAQLQRTAIKMALTKGMLILTGGPGTGKTTTLNCIINILKRSGSTVALAAPTGRAAQRMAQLTGCEAKTIHRLLEVTWNKQDKPVFMRNDKNVLECDALIIDELSMVDSQLFESVMRALPLGCRLIMVGDSDQLPSVGAGNILSDLIACGKIPVVQLNEIFRQSMESLIVTNAHRIVKGEQPVIDSTTGDFFFMKRTSLSSLTTTIAELFTTRLPKSYGLSPLNDIQILCPGRKGQIGTRELNNVLQASINPKESFKREININGTILRMGDKVMQNKNNYDIPWTKDSGETGEGVFNGDIGILTAVSGNPAVLQVTYDDKVALYDAESAADLELAYAVTVHKSQGNEFNAVIIPLYNNPPQLIYRNLLYTAVTRAKKLLIIVGSSNTLYRMVENNKKTLRYSALKDFIIREVE
ncbi:MAG: ATP-dependent RecD-like DNA helicase [Ruminococcus sp.]|nr:ATP-dependent RecD-like DNA helicase [Ruminococcus sp.]MDD6447120.1 ATP-dependent RecD-like DNA helicase [Ruminococcus sp.]MDY2855827.1 ATP-dependent RecD-like DNA helicase [Oscillospiraceae bacterium]